MALISILCHLHITTNTVLQVLAEYDGKERSDTFKEVFPLALGGKEPNVR